MRKNYFGLHIQSVQLNHPPMFGTIPFWHFFKVQEYTEVTILSSNGTTVSTVDTVSFYNKGKIFRFSYSDEISITVTRNALVTRTSMFYLNVTIF